MRKILLFLAFAGTGSGLLLPSILNTNNRSNEVMLIILTMLFLIGLAGHYKELRR